MCVEQNQWDNPYFKWWFHCQEKNEKTIGRKTLRGSDHISRGQNAVFFSVFCGDVLRFFYCTKSDGAERGEHRNMSKQLLKPWCAWNRMCRTNHIFSDTKENAKQKTKNNCLKDNWNIKAPFPCQMHVLCFVLSACQLHYKNGKKTKVHIWECFIPVI